MNFSPTGETSIRLAACVGTLLLMLAWERLFPRRRPLPGHAVRQAHNLLLVALGTLLIRALPLVSMLSAAAVADRHGWGLLHSVRLPFWVDVAGSVVLLDLAIYMQHLVFHRIPLLWRLHRVHHTDREVDTTTGIRFHPLELLISVVYKSGVVILTGAPVAAVAAFEILLNVSSLFNHGNVVITDSVDRALRTLIVTPDMHRVHHSVIRTETDSNYGFNLSIWDRLFGTYRAQPADGHELMQIGQTEFQQLDVVNVGSLLWQPFMASGRTGGSTMEKHDQGGSL